MAKITLITGGARSGKSSFAQRLAESLPGKRLYLATSPVTDPEMAQRIARHRRERQDRGWQTLEEELHLAQTLTSKAQEYEVVLVDCLTLWVNNLMYHGHERFSEDDMVQGCEALLTACRPLEKNIIFVTNEVGLGIVPDNAQARRYRDLVGRCNQILANGASQVFLVTCGIPLQIKGDRVAGIDEILS